MRSRHGRPSSTALVCILASACLAGPAAGREPVTEFLDALRRAEMFDVAADYLQSLPSNPNVSEEVKQTIAYELGRTLIEKSGTIKDPAARMKALDEATAHLQEFIAQHAGHPLVSDANAQLGKVLLERGHALLETARRPANAARKDQLVAEAKAVFAEAQKVFDAEEQRLNALYEEFKPKGLRPDDEDEKERRLKVIGDLRLARIQAATVAYEASACFEPGSEERKQALLAAAEKFHIFYEKYRRVAAGLYAGVYEGRCYQDIGDTKRALAVYESLLLFADEPRIFYDIKADALGRALECWISDTEKQYEVAVQRGEEWLKKARGDDERTREGFGIRYYTALALDKQLEAAKAAGTALDDNKKRELLTHVAFLTKYRNQYTPAAKALNSKHRKIEGTEPTTFAEARDAAKAALDAMSLAEGFIRGAELTRSANELALVPQKEKEAAEARDNAIKFYELAVRLKDDETALDEINEIRYYLCYLYYQIGRMYDAAVLGEFLARKYPDAAGARPAANVAMNAYLVAYNASDPEDRGFEAGRMVGIAEYITSHWPSESEADQAWMMLADIAIREQKLREATEYLKKIPEESPRRGEADLKAGQALWASYLGASRRGEDEERPPKADLDQLVQEAKTTLEKGIQRMRQDVVDPSQVTYTLVASELSLAQIQIGSGQPEGAVGLLERADSGPLALVRAKSEVVQKGNFPEETYKAALRAYVGVQDMQKAEDVMGELEALVASKPDAAAMLTKIYISLGLELEEQVNRLITTEQRAELENVLVGFETFLDRIRTREQGNTFSSLNWVAETYFRLGAGLDTDERQLSQEAKAYYEKAAATYDDMLARMEADSSFAPSPQSAMGLKVRIARSKRELGAFDKALDILATILEENTKILDAQVEAAHTYQAWAEVKPGYYNNAIRGGRKDAQSGENVVWGWAKMAMMLQRNPRHQEMFFEARFNLADCRFRLAMSKEGDKRTAMLDEAEHDVRVVFRLYPELGGEENTKRFDRLLRTIQGAANRKATGLKGLRTPAEQAGARGTTARAGQ